ncbi:tol-pal system YbgF family protein [Thermodesulfobacteriota bacterium]
MGIRQSFLSFVYCIILVAGCAGTGQQPPAVVPEGGAGQPMLEESQPAEPPEPAEMETSADREESPTKAEPETRITDSLSPAIDEKAFPVADAQPPQTEDDPEEEFMLDSLEEQEVFRPGREYISRRLAVNEKKSAGWRELQEQLYSLDMGHGFIPGLDECAALAVQVFSGYQRIDEQLASAEEFTIDFGFDPWMIQELDVQYLEGDCQEKFSAGEKKVAAWIDDFNGTVAEQAELIVGYYAERGEHLDTILAYRSLQANYPEWQSALQTKRSYAFALMYSGELDTAMAIFEELHEDRSLSDRERFKVRRILGDLYLALGRVEKARDTYQRLENDYTLKIEEELWVGEQHALLKNVGPHAEELTFYMAVMQSYLAFDGRHLPDELRARLQGMEMAFPDSVYTHHAREILKKAEVQEQKWIDDRLEVVNGLLEGKEFLQALSLLDALLAEGMEDEMQERILLKREQVLLAEKHERDKQLMMQEQSLAIQWEEAINLLDLRRYDEAIAVFADLIGTDFDQQAQEKINRAENLASVDLRRKAAGLFVKARKTVDDAYKRELLLESHRLLKEILYKYPGAEIIKKVTQNLSVLEEQMIRFDPSLIDRISEAVNGDNPEPSIE